MAKQLRQQRNEDALKKNSKMAVKRLRNWNEKQKLEEVSSHFDVFTSFDDVFVGIRASVLAAKYQTGG